MKWLITQLSILVLFLFTSCTTQGDTMFLHESNESIADKTFAKVVGAIQSEDPSAIIQLLSDEVKGTSFSLEEDADRFIEFIEGDMVSFSNAAESGVGSDENMDRGKTRKDINASFSIETTEKTYYIAIKECVKNDFKRTNVGVLSIYVIEADAWTDEYVYRGDGEWTPGINIGKK